jgi:hypothetical protein
MLNDALLQMQRRLDDNDLTEAGGAAGIKLRLRSSEKRRFTRSSASGEHTKQSTFQTTKDDRAFWTVRAQLGRARRRMSPPSTFYVHLVFALFASDPQKSPNPSR